MEEVDSISVAVSNIDINKVDPLENRRVVAFLNHFLCTTATFLNQFAVKCEFKLDQIQQKLFKIDAALRILESKLESLPVEVQPNPANIVEESSVKSRNLNSDKNETAAIATSNVSSNSVGPKTDGDLDLTSELNSSAEISPKNANVDEIETDQQTSAEDNGESSIKQSHRQDPRYEKYFKMMYVGVPVPAIKQKMTSEGIDPSILDS